MPRLWRPPVEPGEWRTLGLFSGESGQQLEKMLASMPLARVAQRRVTPLAPDPNENARHSGLTAEGELDEVQTTPSAGASERPCGHLHELTTKALRKGGIQ